MVNQFVISSGHGKFVPGAKGYLDEVEDARKVVNRVYSILTNDFNGVGFKFHDDTSTTQNQNLTTIVNFHNSKTRSLDISVHFNSAEETATGSECLYYNAQALSGKMSKAMAKSLGIMDRGAKERKELYFLKETKEVAILLEVCFVTSKKDTEAYTKNFEVLCQAISQVIASELGYSKTNYSQNYLTKKSDTFIAKNDMPKFKGGDRYVKVSSIKPEYYIVKSGDTFFRIAKNYNTTMEKLKNLNKVIKNINKIKVGQKVRVK